MIKAPVSSLTNLKSAFKCCGMHIIWGGQMAVLYDEGLEHADGM